MPKEENKEEKDQKREKGSSTYYDGPASLAPVPLHVASAMIRPIDKTKLKSVALETVEKQANERIQMLRRQAELIMLQVREIEDRVQVSSEIYQADISFEPVIGSVYHLYQKDVESGKRFLSMIGPKEWDLEAKEIRFVASVRLNADKSWDVLEMGDEPISGESIDLELYCDLKIHSLNRINLVVILDTIA